jgi:hypothetical protein
MEPENETKPDPIELKINLTIAITDPNGYSESDIACAIDTWLMARFPRVIKELLDDPIEATAKTS